MHECRLWKNIAETILQGTCYTTAVNESKFVRPTIELDVIGWTRKLEKSQICPNEKGLPVVSFVSRKMFRWFKGAQTLCDAAPFNVKGSTGTRA